MKLKNRYIKCFSKVKSEQLQEIGYKFLYEANGVYYHENNEQVIKFSDNNSNILKGTKYSSWIPL